MRRIPTAIVQFRKCLVPHEDDVSEVLRAGDPKPTVLPTHDSITAQVRPGSPSRYSAANRANQPWVSISSTCVRRW